MALNENLTPWCVTAKVTMLQKRISNKQMADDLGMNRCYLSSILNSKVYSKPAVKKISDYLGIADSDGPTIPG